MHFPSCAQQLPATVMSQEAVRRRYARSLFQRLEAVGHPVTMLDTQYRSAQAVKL